MENRICFSDRLARALAEREQLKISIDGYRPAAVLVPFCQTRDGWELLFTVRSSNLNHHPGQISFPGGKVDSGESLEETALREMHEEIGIRDARILGLLDEHPSPARFIVAPVAAILDWPQPLLLNPAEVEDVFTVPIKELTGIQPRSERRTLDSGMTRTIYFYDYGDRLIWGLTANIVRNLSQILRSIGLITP